MSIYQSFIDQINNIKNFRSINFTDSSGFIFLIINFSSVFLAYEKIVKSIYTLSTQYSVLF